MSTPKERATWKLCPLCYQFHSTPWSEQSQLRPDARGANRKPMSQGRLSECVARRASEEEILLQFYRGLCCALQQPSLAFLGITTSFCRSSSNTSLDTSVSFNCLCLVLFQKRTQNFLPQSHRFLALDGTLEILSSLWSQQLPFPTFFLWSVVLPEATYAGSKARVLPAHGWTPNPRYHSLGKLVSWQ